MKRKSNQSGFSTVEVVPVLVIVAIIGFVGWFVWHSQQTADKTLANSNGSSSTMYKAKSGAVTNFEQCKAAKDSVMQMTYPEQCVTKDGKKFTDTGASSQNYLVIKEWGVKIPLSSDLASAVYTTYNQGSDAAQVSLPSFAGTDCGPDANGLGIFVRFTKDQLNTFDGTPMLTLHPEAQNIGNYYYAYEPVPNRTSCGDVSSATLTKAQDALKATVARIQPTG